MFIILLVPPGSGKRTVANLIQEKYSYPILASGELLRRERAKESPLGKEISDYLAVKT